MNIIDIDKKDSIQSAAQVLKKGGVLIFPTDTVYGIGCALNQKAIEKLYKIKNRPTTQPSAVLMNRDTFDSKRNKKLIIDMEKEGQFLSGQLTLIDDVSHYAIIFPEIITGDHKIGVRLPKYLWLEKLIDETGPIVAASANKKGDKPPTKFSEISPELIKEVDLTIKTGQKLSGKPSAIYDLISNKILRD